MSGPLSFDELTALAGGRVGVLDAPCPQCGPDRRSPHNRVRKVLRVWREQASFATYSCARCGISGWASDGQHVERQCDPAIKAMQARARAAAEAHQAERRAKQAATAQWLWRVAQPAEGPIPQRYLRDVRGIGGPIPETLRFLPARGDYPPSLIAGFGLPDEIEPGRIVLPIKSVVAVQLIKLRADGSGKANEDDGPAKVTVGSPAGSPIVLAPMNDGLGLAICEGAEDALSIHHATGLGAWAAAGWAQLPALAETVPGYADSVTVFADSDPDGRKGAAQLVARLRARSLHVEEVFLDA